MSPIRYCLRLPLEKGARKHSTGRVPVGNVQTPSTTRGRRTGGEQAITKHDAAGRANNSAGRTTDATGSPNNDADGADEETGRGHEQASRAHNQRLRSNDPAGSAFTCRIATTCT